MHDLCDQSHCDLAACKRRTGLHAAGRWIIGQRLRILHPAGSVITSAASVFVFVSGVQPPREHTERRLEGEKPLSLICTSSDAILKFFVSRELLR